MKRYVAVLSIIGLFLSCTHLMSTESTPSFDSTVTGQSAVEQDVKAVQEAVDRGGTVLLKGTFDFGPRGQVNIKNDVAIWGESDGNGRPLTKIIGGFWTFHSPLPSTDLPLPGPGPKIKIKNIHFDGVTWSPMHFPFTSGAEISGNKITNVQPFKLPIKWQGGDFVLVQTGIILGTRFAHKPKYLPGAVTGKLVVENNEIDLKCENPKTTIAKNKIQANGALSSGIISLSDGTLIQENHIELTNGPKTKGITQFGSNGNISKNKIMGPGAWAVGTVSWKSFKGSGNTIEWNDLRGFKASSADFYCTGNENTFIGPECKVIDKGENNKILVRK